MCFRSNSANVDMSKAKARAEQMASQAQQYRRDQYDQMQTSVAAGRPSLLTSMRASK